MVYHQAMKALWPLISSHVRAGGLLILALVLLSSCAPTGPVRTDPPGSDFDVSSNLGTTAEPRAATTDQQRADQAIETIKRQLTSGGVAVPQMLDWLAPYTINELNWQLRQQSHRAPISPWLELALIVQTQKLQPERLNDQLNLWQVRHQARLSQASAHAEAARQWVSTWRGQSHGPRIIGLVLPGQSSLAAPGKRIRDGLMSAWLQLPAQLRPQLKFYYVNDDDTAGLFQALEQAKQDNVKWLIGPLPREQVEFVLANRSARWSVPTLFLNLPRPAGLKSALGGQRLAFALDPETDAHWAARYAARMGWDRALVLAQDTPWGDRMAEEFMASFKKVGHTVVDQAAYNPARVDHSDLLERVLGLDESNARIEALSDILGQPIDAEPQRRRDIEFIFLAARAEDARQLRPQLRFFRAEDLPVVSTSYAIEGAPNPRRDVDLEGVWLPLAPWFLNEPETTTLRQQAQARYPQLTTPTLSHLHAMGQDLVTLMRWWDAMQQDPDLKAPGLTGQLRVASSGQIKRELPWVSIDNGRAQPMVWP